jgi:hypothetical protein
VRLKWHTLAVAGSLGVFASFQPVMADDTLPDLNNPPGARSNNSGDPPSILSQITPREAARKSAGAPSSLGGGESRSENQRLSQELMRQAMVELDAKHFDTARRLTRRAAAIGVASGFSGVHPEQILAEIDRRERGAQVTVPAAPARPDARTQFKARAIELLDRGILALDEKRFDDAEQYGHMAAQLHADWDQFDYKPDNLLDDVRRERAGGGPAAAARPVANAGFEPGNAAPAEVRQPTEWSQRSNPVAPVAVTQQPVAVTETSSAAHTPAQAILEQAMDDLRAGRNELARLRIEQALNSVQGSPQSSPVASFGGYAATANRPVGLTPGGIVPAAPGLTPMPAMSTYFPVRRDQPSMAPLPSQADIALKPMHDPFLGDDATTTDKLSPGAQAMRETLPTGAPVNPIYVNRTAPPAMISDPVQRVGYDMPTPTGPKAQATPDTAALNPQLSWLEKMSVPLPPQGLPPAQAYAGQQTAPQTYASPPFQGVPQPRGYTVTPLAPSGSATVPATDPALANSPDQPKQGFFQKVWGAISGE